MDALTDAMLSAMRAAKDFKKAIFAVTVADQSKNAGVMSCCTPANAVRILYHSGAATNDAVPAPRDNFATFTSTNDAGVHRLPSLPAL